MASVDFLDRVGRWVPSTRVGYGIALSLFASSHEAPNSDTVVDRIKAGELDPYKALERFVSAQAGRGLAPKTVRYYLYAVTAFLQHEAITLDKQQVRLKVGVPPDTESSLDRIPTRNEIRLLLMDSDPRVRAIISLLATSGLRIGEAALLRIGNLNLDEEKVTVMATKTKSHSMRTTFISSEAAKLLRDYLRTRLNNKDQWLFPDSYQPAKPAGRNALYQLIRRALVRDGLRNKLDPDSRMYELHPHCFRKYFFTKLISAGVDRGIAEYLMGHKFGLDNSYLRMDEDHLRKEYMKAEDEFIFLQDRKLDRENKERVDELEKQLKQKDTAILTLQQSISRITILSDQEIEAVRQLIAKPKP